MGPPLVPCSSRLAAETTCLQGHVRALRPRTWLSPPLAQQLCLADGGPAAATSRAAGTAPTDLMLSRAGKDAVDDTEPAPAQATGSLSRRPGPRVGLVRTC